MNVFPGDLQSFEISSSCLTVVQEIKPWKRDEATSCNLLFCFNVAALFKCSNSVLHLSPYIIALFFFHCSIQNERLHMVLLVSTTFFVFAFFCFFTCFFMGNKNKTPAARAKAILSCRPYPTPLLLSVLLGFLTAWIHHHLFQNWAKRCEAWSPYLTWESAASPEWFQSHCRCWSTGCVFVWRKLTRLRLQLQRTLWCTFYFISF